MDTANFLSLYSTGEPILPRLLILLTQMCLFFFLSEAVLSVSQPVLLEKRAVLNCGNFDSISAPQRSAGCPPPPVGNPDLNKKKKRGGALKAAKRFQLYATGSLFHQLGKTENESSCTLKKKERKVNENHKHQRDHIFYLETNDQVCGAKGREKKKSLLIYSLIEFKRST